MEQVLPELVPVEVIRGLVSANPILRPEDNVTTRTAHKHVYSYADLMEMPYIDTFGNGVDGFGYAIFDKGLVLQSTSLGISSEGE